MQPFIEHLSGNKNIKFPFSEQATMHPYLNNSLFVDALFVSHDYIDDYFVSAIDIREYDFDIYINNILYFQNIIKKIYEDYYVAENLILNPACKLVLSPYHINNIPTGMHVFSVQETKFESSCVVPPSERVVSIDALTTSLDDDVCLANGYNSSLSYNNEKLKIDFIPGAGLGYTECEEDPLDNFLYSINQHNHGRNYYISGTECIQITSHPAEKILVVHDKCQPCCVDCDQDIDEVNTSTGDVQTDINSLDARITILEGG